MRVRSVDNIPSGDTYFHSVSGDVKTITRKLLIVVCINMLRAANVSIFVKIIVLIFPVNHSRRVLVVQQHFS